MNKIYIVLLFCHILLATIAKAQVPGCTDPLANNYNPSATQNNGTCTYAPTSVSAASSFILGTAIQETSGLIRWDNHVWTHNDNDDINIYSLDSLNGNIVQILPITGAANIDWEEISQDNDYIYLGDFGNNQNGNRTDLKILKISKSSILAGSPLVEIINFSYSNQTNFSPTGANNTDFDCEACIVTQDSIFLFTKQWIAKKTSVYSLPKTPGTFTANLKTTYDIQGLITGSTLLEQENLVALCGYSTSLQPFIYLLYDYTGNNFFNGNKRKLSVSLPFHQVEGIATNNGLKFYISNEAFSQFPINISQKIHTINLNAYLQNYLSNNNLPVSHVLNLTVLLEGLFNGLTLNKAQNSAGNQFGGTVADQITVELHDSFPPYSLAATPFTANLNTDGSCSVPIPGTLNASYYLVIKHRNSLETWSSVPVSLSGATTSYNFSDQASKAYGNTLKLVSGKYAIYSGDCNQDGVIDSGDIIQDDNAGASFQTGYVASDINGDGIVNEADITFIQSNCMMFVTKSIP